MRVVGIDPGLSGALSLHDDMGLIAVADMPCSAHLVDAYAVAALLDEWQPDVVVLEAVNAFVGSAAKSAFGFGRAFGTVEGVVQACGLPCHMVTAAVWKRKLGLSKDKKESRAMASKLWPTHRADFMLARHDGRAESALIVEAWRRLRGAAVPARQVVMEDDELA